MQVRALWVNSSAKMETVSQITGGVMAGMIAETTVTRLDAVSHHIYMFNSNLLLSWCTTRTALCNNGYY